MTTVHFTGGDLVLLEEDYEPIADLLRGKVNSAYSEQLNPRFTAQGALLSFVGTRVYGLPGHEGRPVTINGAGISYVEEVEG